MRGQRGSGAGISCSSARPGRSRARDTAGQRWAGKGADHDQGHSDGKHDEEKRDFVRGWGLA
jgi:hypothetical protein